MLKVPGSTHGLVDQSIGFVVAYHALCLGVDVQRAATTDRNIGQV